ncbi:MAG: hypothetical protein A3I32_00240 [Candidatus Yanofskybacteria bacterium RIFCSPLOWO2_02_FULL_45_10]|uniref:Glycosyl transferase family 1 domain-containing protein n=3 Tax=Patescibacteria group TaxID=1783273 RepID=A0A1F8G3V6_9BACT|nr:MAG: GT1 family glycosyltransferase [Candidatus Daviesbacteria bacterium GW2011_GWB1_41_5]OGN20024.1 MAG: hypothetical protein A3F25_01650 [Candidatus Yanofskybacteria bacterium RIFCSPHIGHO2_12_FULL_45_19b]OGN31951.1 MAG: hypothetical protein A3I32_00240 [Candidatus Yanofskybacteria bacterium RIFCSPLOWO2_02_FULL_45_10]
MYQIGIECESIEGDSWGVGRITNELLRELANRPELQRAYRFHLYFKSSIPDYDYLNSPLFIKHLVRIPFLPNSFSLYYYLYLPILSWFQKLDLMYFPNYMLPLFFGRKSLVVTTNDVYREMHNKDLPWRYRLAYRIFATWAAKQATRLMTISTAAKTEIAQLFKIKPERISVNYLAVKKPELGIINNDTLFLIPDSYLLYVGQAFPRRHLRETMLAFEKIAPRFPNLKLFTVGQDKYRPAIIESLRQTINQRLGSERIIHRNRVSEAELVNLYQHARLVIYLSDSEAFGLPPLEGLANGTIPVVVDEPLNQEIYGEQGAIFVKDPYDIEAVASTLTDALENQAKRSAIEAQSKAITEKFTWQKHATRWLKLVREIV